MYPELKTDKDYWRRRAQAIAQARAHHSIIGGDFNECFDAPHQDGRYIGPLTLRFGQKEFGGAGPAVKIPIAQTQHWATRRGRQRAVIGFLHDLGLKLTNTSPDKGELGIRMTSGGQILRS